MRGNGVARGSRSRENALDLSDPNLEAHFPLTRIECFSVHFRKVVRSKSSRHRPLLCVSVGAPSHKAIPVKAMIPSHVRSPDYAAALKLST